MHNCIDGLLDEEQQGNNATLNYCGPVSLTKSQLRNIVLLML